MVAGSYIYKMTNRMPYLKNFGFSQAYKLFSTIVSYEVRTTKQISYGLENFAERSLKPFVEMTINTQNEGSFITTTAISIIPSTDEGIYILHQKFIKELIQQQINNPESSVTATVSEPFNILYYEVMKIIGSTELLE